MCHKIKSLADNTTANTPNNSMAEASNDSMADSSNKTMSDSSDHTVSDSVANSNSLRVDSSALVGHLSHVSVNIVGVVVDVLDATVRKVDRVGSLPSSSAIVRLRSVEASSRVVVGHSVLVGVRGNLVRVHLRHSMTHDRMANTMANTMADTMAKTMADADSVTNANTMADSDAMADANTMADSDTMSKPPEELRSGRRSGCQGRNDQRSLKIFGLTRSDDFGELVQYAWMEWDELV